MLVLPIQGAALDLPEERCELGLGHGEAGAGGVPDRFCVGAAETPRLAN
jgi:hypothetical protein